MRGTSLVSRWDRCFAPPSGKQTAGRRNAGKFRDNEKGQVLVITAVCMVALLGFLALAVDVGVLFHTRWELQTAADAAATAAAVEYVYNGNSRSGAITAGTNAATANNVNDGNTMTPSVTVNANPISPAAHKVCSGTTCFFEAVVSKPNPTFFYRAFFSLWSGSSSSGFTVSARAVAGTTGNATGCIYLTDAAGTAFTANGKYQINASGCGLYVNSTSSSAMTGKGSSGSIDVASVSAVGSTSGYTANFASGTTMTSDVLPEAIPFTGINPPSPTGCVAPSGGKLTSSTGPGCYSGAVTIGGGITLSAGTYIFTGDVTINGSVSGTGVAFDITTGALTVKPGSATINLTPPTSGTFNGVSIYMPATNSNTIGLQAGSATGTIAGFIVAPGATFTMQDNGGSMTIGGLVVDNIDNGPAQLDITGYSPASSPLKTVALVE